MSEYIRRQAALGYIEHVLTIGTGKKKSLEYIRKYIEALPSVHPELDEWCETCKEYDTEKHCCPRWNRVIREAVKQTEIIRCKDCRFYRPMIDQDDLCTYRQMQVFEDDYCSRAERKEDETS